MSISAYYYQLNALNDILTKREYLYRQLLFTNEKIASLPISLTNSPKNPLIEDIKSLFSVTDVIINNTEYSREAHYFSLKFFNFNILKSILLENKFINLTQSMDFFFVYFFNLDANSDLNNLNSNDLYKNQYRPLKKGISNMIRLHATGAIAMPTEIRLQLLASSKDVIHS